MHQNFNIITMNLLQSGTVTFVSCILTYYIINIANNAMANNLVAQQNDSGTVSVEKQSNRIYETQPKRTNGKRKTAAVKLTMKQGLLMNQILAAYGVSNVRNALCKAHIEEFKQGLRAFEAWALKMFDSSSKVQSGILIGNLVEYGSFEQCLHIHKEIENAPAIHGKLCSFKIIPGNSLVKTILKFRNISERRFEKLKESVLEEVKLIWSVCVPDSCTAQDVFPHFNRSITEILEGLDIRVTLNEENCVSLNSQPSLTSKQYYFLTFFSALIALVLISSIIDWKIESKLTCIRAFSIIANTRRILTIGKSNSELNCLHGIRFFSTCYVLFGHRFMAGMLFPSINSLYLLDWILNYSSTVIIGGTICVDSFFLVSGTLVSFIFFKTVTKTGQFNLLLFYLHRYLRITPGLCIVVIIYTTFIQFFGSGPLWHDTFTGIQTPCQYFWWSTLLHIQSYVNPHALCIPQTWFLTCDTLYYYFSPVIIYPLWKWPKFGYANLIVIYILSVAVSFSLAWTNQYEGGMPLTNQLFHTKYFQKHYITPHARASPYIIGLGFGYIIFKTKDKQIKIHPFINITCWIITIILMSTVVLYSHLFQKEQHHYNRLESSLFLSCSRSVWVSGLVWMIWSSVHGYGGPINYILSLDIFRIFGRIGYGIFLFHLLFQFLKDGAAKVPGYFSNFDLIYDYCADLVLMIIVGFLFALFIEYPFMGIETLIVKKLSTNRKVNSRNI